MKIIVSIMVLGMLLASAGCSNPGTSEANSAETIDPAGSVTGNSSVGDIKPEYLTAESFREKIWDYKQSPEDWVYNGDLPCIVDFYADWCKPCKLVAPIMDELADHYEGKVLIYKVNTDEQRELATVFQVRSIPSILFAPMEGKPAMQAGAMSKDDYIRIIDEYVLKVNKQNNDKSES